MIKKEFSTMLSYVKSVNVDNRTIRFVISSDKLDRHRERIEVSAIADAIAGFAKNPCCLAGHQSTLDNGHSPVIGSWDTESFRALAHTSEMDLHFAETELAEEYWQLYNGKHMNAVSIGFIPLEWHEVQDDKLGRHWVTTKLELLEISCVPIPANREALAKKGSDLAKTLYSVLKSEKDHTQAAELLRKVFTDLFDEFKGYLEEQLDEIKSIIIPDQDGYADQVLGWNSEQDDPAGPDKDPEQLKSFTDKLNCLAARVKS